MPRSCANTARLSAAHTPVCETSVAIASSSPRSMAVRLDPLQRAAGRGRHRALGRQYRRQLRQRAGRDHQWAVQGRDHPPALALEDARGGRIGHPRVGLVVQPPSLAGAHRLHPAGRSRGKLLARTSSGLDDNQGCRVGSASGGLNHEYMAQPGGPPAAPAGGWKRETEPNTVRPSRSDSSQQASSKPGAVQTVCDKES